MYEGQRVKGPTTYKQRMADDDTFGAVELLIALVGFGGDGFVAILRSCYSPHVSRNMPKVQFCTGHLQTVRYMVRCQNIA